MNLKRCGVLSVAGIFLLMSLIGCSEQGGSISLASGDMGWLDEDGTTVDLGTIVDGSLTDESGLDGLMDTALQSDASSMDTLAEDAGAARVEPFTTAEADERIERDCGGCHTEGGTGSSRRLGWDNMSYQLVYLSVKDPWTASSTRMPQGGEYWSETDIERIRLLYVAERERSEVD